jgi:hypothetical protein
VCVTCLSGNRAAKTASSEAKQSAMTTSA